MIVKLPGKINKIETNKTSFNVTIKGQAFPIEPGNLGFTIRIFKDKEILFTSTHKNAMIILHE
jgi:hypothetical protein